MTSPGEMVSLIREKYGLKAPGVFAAMLSVPRDAFVPERFRESAYSDGPVPIGKGQTISQPFTVAFMTHLLGLKGEEKVLEIGTGSGYQAAVLSLLSKEVFTIERIKSLALSAKKRLKKLGYKNVRVKAGSGEEGWKDVAPFDAILVTAGMEKVPKQLFEQLGDGGVIVAPVGKGMDKAMSKYSKNKGRISKKTYGIFHFVPFVQK